MRYEITVRKEAEYDLKNIFQYYEDVRFGLGHDLLLCVEEAISKVQRNPTIYKIIYKNLRRIAVRRFPFRLFYFIDSDRIIVVAIFHAQKDPKSWSNRI